MSCFGFLRCAEVRGKGSALGDWTDYLATRDEDEEEEEGKCDVWLEYVPASNHGTTGARPSAFRFAASTSCQAWGCRRLLLVLLLLRRLTTRAVIS